MEDEQAAGWRTAAALVVASVMALATGMTLGSIMTRHVDLHVSVAPLLPEVAARR